MAMAVSCFGNNGNYGRKGRELMLLAVEIVPKEEDTLTALNDWLVTWWWWEVEVYCIMPGKGRTASHWSCTVAEMCCSTL